ncbi:hypothetical protein [Stappia sp.]|uniref:hypothetical protein n=1 Tax=Stappia sp. TaxID=1870903 RepID=UPI0032D8CD1B
MTRIDRDEARKREAEESLARVRRDSESLFEGSVRAGTRGKAEGGAPPQDDPIEVLGTKIGRTAGILFAIGLVIYLVWTYL